MREFTGTNGPWQVGSETVGGDIRIIDPNGYMVAMTEAKTGDGYLWSPSTVAENANLIAAAPELLEALQEAMKFSMSEEVYDKCSAAVAKALGQ